MKRLFLLALLVLCTMCGCTKLNTTDTRQPEYMSPTPTLTQKPTEGLSEAEKYLLDKEPISYVPDGDAHAYFFTLKFAPTEKGVYYFSEGSKFGTVYFYDIANKKSAALCSRADCNHRVKDCTAYRAADEYYQEALLYDSGRIYMMATTDEGGYLDSWAEDGSDYKRVVKLWDINTYTLNYNTYFNRIAMIHRGYFYYAWSEDYFNCHIMRVKVDGTLEPEELALIDTKELAEGAWGTLMYASGDNVYVLLNQQPASSSIHRIDTQTKAVTLLYSSESGNRGIYVEDDKVYTIDYDTLYRIDAFTGEKTLLYKLPYGGILHMASDGEHIFIDNYYVHHSVSWGYSVDERASLDLQRTVYILDMEGKLVDEIVLGGGKEEGFEHGHVFFGDKRYIFAMIDDEIYDTKLSYFDKRLIGSGLYDLESGLYEWEPVGY